MTEAEPAGSKTVEPKLQSFHDGLDAKQKKLSTPVGASAACSTGGNSAFRKRHV
jgi:hypothetical protein